MAENIKRCVASLVTICGLTAFSFKTRPFLCSRVSSLAGLPEELVCKLFNEVLLRSKLDPQVLQLFRDTEHDQMLAHIAALNIQPVPVMVLSSKNKWLGDKPHWG